MKKGMYLFIISVLTIFSMVSCKNKESEKNSETLNNSNSISINEIESYPISDSVLQIHSLEVKQKYGDATLIKYDDFDILVDGGERGDDYVVKTALEKYVSDNVLDLLIVTHPHSDHVGGIINRSTFSSIKSITTIIDTGYNYGTRKYFKSNIIDYYVPLGSKYYTISQVMNDESLSTIKISNLCSLIFLNSSFYSKASTTSNINNTSIAFYIKYNNTILYMGGDGESAAEYSIMELNEKFTTKENTVIFKASHHGSNGANMQSFMNYIQPDYCFVSAALTIQNNANINLNQHPYSTAIARIARHTKEIYWNGINGNINIYADSQSNILIEGEGRSKNYTYYNKNDKTSLLVEAESEKNTTYLNSKWYQFGIENANWINFNE